MTLIKIYTDKGFHSEIETADDLYYIKVDGKLVFSTSSNSDYTARKNSPKVSPPKDAGFIDGKCQVCGKDIHGCKCEWEEKPIA